MDEQSNMPWTPPGMEEAQVEAFLAFKDGLPAGMRPLIQHWLLKVLKLSRTSSRSYSTYRASIFLDFQLQMNRNFNWAAGDYYFENQVRHCFGDLESGDLVFFVDFVLAQESHYQSDEDDLEKILLNGRSNWSVGERFGRPGLVGRVPGAVAQVVESITDSPTIANNLLRKAWAQAYGVTPDPPAAYSCAVKAVEVYSTKIFSPKTNMSTLGKDLATFRAKPDKWEFRFGNHDLGNHQHLLGMMSLLWNSQSDRHGSEDYKDVSIEQARAAVLLASTLIGWFDQRLIELKDEYRG